MGASYYLALKLPANPLIPPAASELSFLSLVPISDNDSANSLLLGLSFLLPDSLSLSLSQTELLTELLFPIRLSFVLEAGALQSCTATAANDGAASVGLFSSFLLPPSLRPSPDLL